MDLKEKLNKFWSQQEKCQLALVGIAAEAAPLKARPAASAAAQKSPVPLKFSNETERLQYINSIRKSPVGAQIKRVLDLLREVPVLTVLAEPDSLYAFIFFVILIVYCG